jgi:WD40 repeat protein
MSDQQLQGHMMDLPSMQDISLLLKDTHYAARVYAVPINTHALQVYQSVLATGPRCALLDYMRRCVGVAPCQVSHIGLGWKSGFEGHRDKVLSVTFSPDGLHIVSGSQDKTILMWDAQTGHQLAMLEGHSGCVSSVAFSFDGTQIVSGSEDKSVRVWNARTGQQAALFEGHTDWVWTVAFSKGGAHIVSGSGDHSVRVWDMRSGKQLSVLVGHNDWALFVAFSPDGAQIVSGSDDNTVRVWDTRTGNQLAVIDAPCKNVRSLAFSLDGENIISSDVNGREFVWNRKGTTLSPNSRSKKNISHIHRCMWSCAATRAHFTACRPSRHLY